MTTGSTQPHQTAAGAATTGSRKTAIPGPQRGEVAEVAELLPPTGAKGTEAAESVPLEERDPEALLKQWLHGIRIGHVGHTRAASVFESRARALGLLTTLATVVVGTTLFASLSESPDPRVVAFAAVVSVVAVILSALQTFLNYGQLVTAHRAAAGAYGDLRRRGEQLIVFGDARKLRDPMAGIASQWTKLEQDSPDLPQGFFRYATNWVDKRDEYDRLKTR